jgi:hypothetical protein
MKMNSKKIILNGSFIVFGIAFTALMMWYLPDKALELLIVSVFSVGGATLLLRGAKVDQRKDERTIQLMTLGGRNAFIFLLLAMPALASLDIAGILILGTPVALLILWVIAMAIAWITFLYYYLR